jgi:putative ABC transport system permease protein
MIAFHIALQNLKAASSRTFFLGAALFLVTLLMVVLLSLTSGISDNMIKATTTVSSGHINIGGFYKTTPTDAPPLVTKVAELKQVVHEALPDAVRVIDRQRGWGKIISDQGTVQAGINGIDYDDEGQLLSMLVQAPAGDYIEKAPDPKRVAKPDFTAVKKGGIILFAGQAKRLKVDVGDPVSLRAETGRGQVNTVDSTVVAIAKDLGPLSGWASFVSKDTVAKLYQLKPDVSGAIQIYFDDVNKSEDGMNRLRAAMIKKGYPLMDHESQPFFMKFQTVMSEDWTGQKYDITTWKDEASFLTWILTAISSVSFLLLSLLTVIIAVGIMNTMYIAVRERTREIGTLRAIGMSRAGILRLFLLEALTLGLIATTAGAVVGMIVAAAVDAGSISIGVDAVRMILLSDTIHLAARLADVVTAIVTFTVLTGLSALLPALQASRVAPVTAMQAAD